MCAFISITTIFITTISIFMCIVIDVLPFSHVLPGRQTAMTVVAEFARSINKGMWMNLINKIHFCEQFLMSYRQLILVYCGYYVVFYYRKK
jgi:hypothetical protein